MGSGLILLAIVGAWLAVLVPMALRKHEASNLGTVDKFHDAMRVLSRRHGAAAADEPEPEDAPEQAPPGRLRAAATALRTRAAARRQRPRATAAQRRRRLLITLLVASVGALGGAVAGSSWLLATHVLVDLLLVAFVVHLRRTAVARAEREWRRAMATPRAPRQPAPAAAPEAAPALRVPAHVAGIPDRMPPRVPAAQPAARLEEPAPARGAQGAAWSPVPVPAPTYLSAPAAPRATVARAAADGLADAERELGIVDQGPELDDILDRRRAVND